MERLISTTLLIAVAFTALAFGTVEAWSVVIFELLVVVMLLFWTVKSLADRRLEISVPGAALPLAQVFAHLPVALLERMKA